MLTKTQQQTILNQLKTETVEGHQVEFFIMQLLALSDRLTFCKQEKREMEQKFSSLKYSEMQEQAATYSDVMLKTNCSIYSYSNNIKKYAKDLLKIFEKIVFVNHITSERKATETTSELLNNFVCDTLEKNGYKYLVKTNTYTGNRYNDLMNVSLKYDGFYASNTDIDIYHLLNDSISSRVDWKRDTIETIEKQENPYKLTTKNNYLKAHKKALDMIEKVNKLSEELNQLLKDEINNTYGGEDETIRKVKKELNDFKYLR